jgi:hypothetical protein
VSGEIADFQLYAASFSGQRIGNLDFALILDFQSFTATAKWKDIDRQMPGGLSADGLKLGRVEHLTLAYSIGEARAKKRNPATAAHVLGLYEATVGDAEYIKYARGYVEPQMKGWLDAGALTAYRMFMIQPGQNPSAAPFTFLLTMEYANMAALAGSDDVKERVRVLLEKDAAWKALSDEKSSKRRARGFVIADAIVSP